MYPPAQPFRYAAFFSVFKCVLAFTVFSTPIMTASSMCPASRQAGSNSSHHVIYGHPCVVLCFALLESLLLGYRDIEQHHDTTTVVHCAAYCGELCKCRLVLVHHNPPYHAMLCPTVRCPLHSASKEVKCASNTLPPSIHTPFSLLLSSTFLPSSLSPSSSSCQPCTRPLPYSQLNPLSLPSPSKFFFFCFECMFSVVCFTTAISVPTAELLL